MHLAILGTIKKVEVIKLDRIFQPIGFCSACVELVSLQRRREKETLMFWGRSAVRDRHKEMNLREMKRGSGYLGDNVTSRKDLFVE